MPTTLRSAYGFLADIRFSKLNVTLTKNGGGRATDAGGRLGG